LDFLVRFLRSIWGVCPTRRGVFHETEANHANLCLVVDCFRGEIHQSREAGAPEWPQPEARRPLAQSRPPTAPQKKSRPSQTQFFISLCLPNHTSTDQVTTSLRSLIAVSRSLLAAWGFGAAPAYPRDPKSDGLLSGAGKTSLPLAAVLRGGRAPSLASLVANGCFLTSLRYSILEHKQVFPR
jgi:hypothetical protein